MCVLVIASIEFVPLNNSCGIVPLSAFRYFTINDPTIKTTINPKIKLIDDSFNFIIFNVFLRFMFFHPPSFFLGRS